jgi:hypothetical protein
VPAASKRPGFDNAVVSQYSAALRPNPTAANSVDARTASGPQGLLILVLRAPRLLTDNKMHAASSTPTSDFAEKQIRSEISPGLDDV